MLRLCGIDKPIIVRELSMLDVAHNINGRIKFTLCIRGCGEKCCHVPCGVNIPDLNQTTLFHFAIFIDNETLPVDAVGLLRLQTKIIE